jgi:hypothetical protein
MRHLRRTANFRSRKRGLHNVYLGVQNIYLPATRERKTFTSTLTHARLRKAIGKINASSV